MSFDSLLADCCYLSLFFGGHKPFAAFHQNRENRAPETLQYLPCLMTRFQTTLEKGSFRLAKCHTQLVLREIVKSKKKTRSLNTLNSSRSRSSALNDMGSR